MLQSHEEQLLTNIDQLTNLLSDGSYLSAYPGMHGIFYGIRSGLDVITATIMRNRRHEIVHGLDQASLLYKIMTGKSVGIPKEIINNYNPIGNVTYMPVRPVTDIVDYAKLWHGLDNEILTFEQEGVVSEYNTEDNSVVVKFKDSDGYLKFPSAGTNKADLYSPLLHEPMTLGIEIPWMVNAFHTPLIDLLCVKEHIVDDGKEVLDKLWDSPDENFEVIEIPESVKQLTVLLAGRMYGKACRGFCRFVLNGYQFTLETEERWTPTRHHALKITSVTVGENNNSAYQWYKNPILVMDLRESLEAKAEELLRIHELEMKEDPNAC